MTKTTELLKLKMNRKYKKNKNWYAYETQTVKRLQATNLSSTPDRIIMIITFKDEKKNSQMFLTLSVIILLFYNIVQHCGQHCCINMCSINRFEFETFKSFPRFLCVFDKAVVCFSRSVEVIQ